MLDSAREALDFVFGKSRSDLSSDRMLTLSVVKCIEIIGEAACQITDELKARYPQIPWQDIVSMRHRLVHAYFTINLNILWKTVTKDLPPLIKQLETVINTEQGS
jgi:uncharacterized protein with HEPN domain